MDRTVPQDTYWARRHPARIIAELAPVEVQGRWDASMEVLTGLFAEDVQFFGNAPAPYDSLRVTLESFQAAVRDTDNVGRSKGVEGAGAFNVVARGNAFAVLNTRLLADESFNSDQLRSLCYTVHNVHRYVERLTLWARVESQKELEALVRRWNSFNDVGMTPYPWELLGNRVTGWLGSSGGLAPPSRQLILFRPEIGAEVDRSFNERQNVVAVELIGAVGYVGNSGWYLGGSLIWTSPSTGPSGLGAMAHFAHWLKGGPIWRDRDGDGDRELGWILSIDAFDLLKGPPRELVQRAEAAISTAREARSGG